jgi:hypothetical protein
MQEGSSIEHLFLSSSLPRCIPFGTLRPQKSHCSLLTAHCHALHLTIFLDSPSGIVRLILAVTTLILALLQPLHDLTTQEGFVDKNRQATKHYNAKKNIFLFHLQAATITVSSHHC